MKLFKTLAIALGVTALSLSAIGCGDACEAAQSHSEDCGFTSSDSDAEVECTDQLAAVAECMVDLSCDELNNTDYAAELACAAATP